MKQTFLFSFLTIWLCCHTTFAVQSYTGLDFRTWRAVNYASSEVNEAGFSGVTNHAPYLITPESTTIDADANPQMELLLESNESYLSIYFAHAGEELSEERKLVCSLNASQMSGDLPVVIPCKSHPLWTGDITILRFDIGREGGNQVHVHQILFHSHSENIVPNGDFSMRAPKEFLRPRDWNGTGHFDEDGRFVLAPGEEILSSPLELIPKEVSLAYHCKASKGISVEALLCDIFGKEIARTQDSPVIPPREAATVRFALRNNGTENAVVSEAFAKILPSQDDWHAQWIWAQTDDPLVRVVLRRKFFVENPADLAGAQLQITADDELTLRINGHLLKGTYAGFWNSPDVCEIIHFLQHGENLLEAYVVNNGYSGGLLGELALLSDDGQILTIPTDHEWECAITGITGNPGPAAEDAFTSTQEFQPAIELGTGGCPPWGTLPHIPLRTVRAKCRISGLRENYTKEDSLVVVPELYDRKCLGSRHSPQLRPATLFLEKGNWSVPVATLDYDAPSPDGRTQHLVTANVPLRYLPEGEWTIRIEMPDVQTENSPVLGKFQMQGHRGSELPDTLICRRNGVPTFFLKNSEEVLTDHGLLDMTNSPVEIEEERNLLANGLKGMWLHFSNWQYDVENDNFSFDELDRICTRILLQEPAVHFLVCLEISSRSMRPWLTRHPEELCRVYGGSSQVSNYAGDKMEFPSLASTAWLAFGDRLLAALVEHLRKMPYGERVIGLAPSSGITWEWMYWGAQHKDYCDYSTPFLHGFRAWMRERYGDMAKLRDAWQSQDESFDTLELPTPEEREATGIADLHDQQTTRKLLDYQDYFSHVVSTAIIHYCDTVKRLTDGRLLAGIYYGYTNFVLGGQWIPRIGHFALARVLDAPSVDFLISPTRYSDRGLCGAGGYMLPVASVALHGKMFVCESDIRTVFSGTQQFGGVSTLLDSRVILEREMGANLASGVSAQWYDFSRGWIGGDPRLAQVVGKLPAFEEEMRTAEPPPNLEEERRDTIAVFIDERSHVAQVMGSQLGGIFVAQQYPQLFHTGAKIDQYLFSDLSKVGKQYQCLVFLNAWRLTEEDLRAIEALKNNGRTMLFLYGVGVTGEKGVSQKATERILGVPFAMEVSRLPHELNLTSEGRHFFGDQAPEQLVCPDAYGPIFTPVQEENSPAKILGTLEDGRPALIQIDSQNCRLFFCALPRLPGSWLAAIARNAGVTIHDDNHLDVVWAGQNVLSIHAVKGGTRLLNFPFATGSLKNLMTSEHWSIQNGKCKVSLPDNATTLFRTIPQ